MKDNQGSVSNFGLRHASAHQHGFLGDDIQQAGDEGSLRLYVATADVLNLPFPAHRHRLIKRQSRSGLPRRRPEMTNSAFRWSLQQRQWAMLGSANNIVKLQKAAA